MDTSRCDLQAVFGLMDRKEHWEKTYAARRSDGLSWYQEKPDHSLAMIHRAGTGLDEPIIDVGGGASVLVDHLLQEGYKDLTVLDISSIALEKARERLGTRSGLVRWIENDITAWAADRSYSLWHDRAVFHFLTRQEDRNSYVRALHKCLPSGGQAIIAAFAIGGPEKCSGLEIVQYDSNVLATELGAEFRLLEQAAEEHYTPAGALQKFGYYRFIRE